MTFAHCLYLGDIKSFQTEDGTEFTSEFHGSNAWATSGKFNETGNSILSGDPHLAIMNPGFFYHLHAKSNESDIHFTGASLPGVPGLMIGHNQNVAWSITLSYVRLKKSFQIFETHEKNLESLNIKRLLQRSAEGSKF